MRISGWNSKGLDSRQCFLVINNFAMRVTVSKTLAITLPRNTRMLVSDIAQADSLDFLY